MAHTGEGRSQFEEVKVETGVCRILFMEKGNDGLEASKMVCSACVLIKCWNPNPKVTC